MAAIPADKGTYALLLRLDRPRRLRIGSLGAFDFPEGLYVYIGSAFGPGGLRARIAHHAGCSARPHWHLDFLRKGAAPVDAWYLAGVRLECAWASRFQRAAGVTMPVPGFGASDCRCPTHLFRIERAGANGGGSTRWPLALNKPWGKET